MLTFGLNSVRDLRAKLDRDAAPLQDEVPVTRSSTSLSQAIHTFMRRHYPSWREARAELNELPLAAVSWRV